MIGPTRCISHPGGQCFTLHSAPSPSSLRPCNYAHWSSVALNIVVVYQIFVTRRAVACVSSIYTLSALWYTFFLIVFLRLLLELKKNPTSSITNNILPNLILTQVAELLLESWSNLWMRPSPGQPLLIHTNLDPYMKLRICNLLIPDPCVAVSRTLEQSLSAAEPPPASLSAAEPPPASLSVNPNLSNPNLSVFLLLDTEDAVLWPTGAAYI